MTPIEAAYASALSRMPNISLDEFKAYASQCDVHPVCVNGECAGALIVNGSEIHACILPWAQGLWFSRKHARILNDVIAKHGKAITKATTEQGRFFVSRLGFVEVGDHWEKDVPYGN